jgi:hypothetical protein
VECDNFLQEDRNGQVFDGGDYYTDIETFRSYERVWKDLTCVAQSGAHPIASSIGSTRTNFQDKRFCWFVVEIVQSGQSRQSIRLWCPNPPQSAPMTTPHFTDITVRARQPSCIDRASRYRPAVGSPRCRAAPAGVAVLAGRRGALVLDDFIH